MSKALAARAVKQGQTSKHLIVFTLRSTCFRVVVIRIGRQHASAELRRCVDVPSSSRDGLVKVFFLNGILSLSSFRKI